MNEPTQQNNPPTATEWLGRFKARLIERGAPQEMVDMAAAAIDMYSGEDSTHSLDESPEDAADDEISYWEHDELPG